MVEKLGALGLRSTNARVLILSFLENRKDHPTAESILRSLRQRGHQVGPATLYQNLSKLADVGLIARLNGPDGLMHFDATVEPHPHLACITCSRIVDVRIDEAMLRELRPSDPISGEPLSDWLLEEVRLELKGLCPSCQGKN
jgi:Fur family peroxide stress response transcriptional regulator